jgi:small subunit ribosomal protein S13
MAEGRPHKKSPIAAPLWGHRRFYLEAQGSPISTMIYTSLQMIPILMSYKNSMPPKVPVVPHRSIHSSCFLIRGGISQESALSTALRQSQQGQRGTRSGNISNGEAFELVITNLSKIRGLGRSVVRRYLNYVGLSPSTRIRDLTNHQENRLYQDFDKWLTSCNFVIGNNHKEAKNDNLQKLRSIQTYRGIRNAKGLPVRGQKTKSNGRTKRKLRIN